MNYYKCTTKTIIEAMNEQEAIVKFCDFLNDSKCEFDVEIEDFDPELDSL